jgi:hypothetical protein
VIQKKIKAKGKVHLIPCHEDTEGVVEVYHISNLELRR